MEHRGIEKEGTPAKPGPTTPSKSLGTFGTAKTIVKHRGLMGLYSGFHLHLRKSLLGHVVCGVEFLTTCT